MRNDVGWAEPFARELATRSERGLCPRTLSGEASEGAVEAPADANILIAIGG